MVDIEHGWQGWDIFIERLFCEVDQLDALCKNCHLSKSNHEVQMRKYFRAKRKAQNEDDGEDEE